jgi:hypothetical protein
MGSGLQLSERAALNSSLTPTADVRGAGDGRRAICSRSRNPGTQQQHALGLRLECDQALAQPDDKPAQPALPRGSADRSERSASASYSGAADRGCP